MTGMDLPPYAASHREVSAWRTQKYADGLIDGSHQRFAVQLFLYCDLILFIYLLTPSLKGSAVRWSVFAANFAVQLWVVLNVRTQYPTFGLIIGFFCGWNILWSANLLIFNNARDRYKKIKRTPGNPPKYEWQPLPKDNIVTRLGWAADLVFNSRGIGWDWKVSGTPSRPPAVEASLQGISVADAKKSDVARTSQGRIRFDTPAQALAFHGRQLLQAYVILDLLKTIMNHDPYFWGMMDQPPPSYLPAAITSSPILTSLYRTLISLMFVWQALELSFAIPQLVLLSLFTPDTAGCNAEAWIYPNQFGSFTSAAKSGLAGFWSGWWHQLFRNAFKSASTAISKLLKLKSRSPEAAGIELITSFTISGLLHTAASATMLGPTRPFTRMYLFFALQPAGILPEVIFAHFFGRSSIGRKTPWWLAYSAHTIYTCLWFYLTGPVLIHELVTGGVFLYEPVPISVFRGLGFGATGDTAFCWEGLRISWYWDASRPWLSGLVA